MIRLAFGALVLSACAGSPPPPSKAPAAPPPTTAKAKAPLSADEKEAAADKVVQVHGLKGTMHAFDVRDTMERRTEALAACQQARIRRVRHLAGSIELAIHVHADGRVGQVDVVHSDLGDHETEACIVQVTQATPFPAPHGGDTDVKWGMALEPLTARPPGTYEDGKLDESLELQLPDLAAACEMKRRSPPLSVTAYVAPNGRVLSAGVSSPSKGQTELMACAAQHVGTWRMPRGRGVTKAQFTARFRPALTDKRREAIREKYVRKRKAERKRKQAEARRARKRRARRTAGRS